MNIVMVFSAVQADLVAFINICFVKCCAGCVGA